MADDNGGGEGPVLTVIEGGGEPAKKRQRRKRRALTAKQEAFVRGLIKGLSQADAYRAAYECANMGSHAIHCEASQLAAHPEVTQRLLAHQTSVERSELSHAATRRRWIVERLTHEATNSTSDAARVRALELLGKDSAVKMWTEVQEHVEVDASPDEVREQLEARLTALLADG